MLKLLFLIIIIIGATTQNIVKKPYTQKNGENGVYLFTMLTSLSALLFFSVTSSNLKFNLSVLPYSFLFAIFYSLTTVFNVLAVSAGSLSLTSLFISYSFIIPTFYGLVFLNDSINFGFAAGIILLIISLLIINKKSNKTKISFKWIIYTAISLFSNGMCSVVQKSEQNKFDGGYKNEFMIFALSIVTVLMLIATFIKERKEIKTFIKTGWCPALVGGIMNGTVNLFVMLITAIVPISTVFPLISAGSIITTSCISVLFYKEKFTKAQLFGLALGVISIIFFNI